MDYFTNLLESLTSRFGNVLPTVIGAIVVLILGFFIAGLLKRLTRTLLKKTSIDENISKKFKTKFRLDEFLAKLVYYIFIIYTLLIVLNLLGVTSVLEPLENMLQKFMGYVPNILAGGVIGFAGYIIASIASEGVGFLSSRLEDWGQNLGLQTGNMSLTTIVKQIVFIIIFIPILIVALDALKMEAISGPASEMLESLLLAIPKILAAAILLAVFYIVGRYVINIVVTLLQNLGFDTLANKLGVDSIMGPRSLSKLVGNIGLFFIMFTGLIAAADKLELSQLNNILSNVFDISGRIFFGLVILSLGIFLSGMISKYFSTTNQKPWVITVAKFAVMGLFLSLALHTMGIAPAIVNLAFGLTLGAIAIAFALAFGLGGREAAGEELKRFFKKMRT